MVTDEQVKLYRRKRMKEMTQEAAAAAAEMSVRTGRKWESGLLPSQRRKARSWRTREDPFVEVWAEIEVILRDDKEGKLQSKTLFDDLCARFPGRFDAGQLRTLQRRIRDWRAVSGPAKEVVFPQEHPAGREAAFDFTHCDALAVTICGSPFSHLLFTFRLSHSGWTWVQLAFSETFEALISGLQGALWDLGGVPEVVRHDNLSAATHALAERAGRVLNRRYKSVLEHYGLQSTRIEPGKPNQNGIAEKGNDLIKTALNQALILRGDRDFASAESYMAFVHQVVERSNNASRSAKFISEQTHLKPLPAAPVPSYSKHTPTVRSWSTIRVSDCTYSVPSRLIGHQVLVHQHADFLEVFYKDKLVEMLPRIHRKDGACINYRHIIWSLVRKPGAFARYRFREELFPSLFFRRAYDALQSWRGERADIEYVRILHLAAATMEADVECALELLLERKEPFDYATVKDLAHPEPQVVPKVDIPKPNLRHFDNLYETLKGAC